MKKIFVLTLILFCLLGNTILFAKSGPTIPVPEVSISEAIDIAEEYFYTKETGVIDGDYFKVEDYILISAEYTNYIEDESQKEWCWVITFIHPVQNDHSVVYKVMNNKEILLLYQSE